MKACSRTKCRRLCHNKRKEFYAAGLTHENRAAEIGYNVDSERFEVSAWCATRILYVSAMPGSGVGTARLERKVFISARPAGVSPKRRERIAEFQVLPSAKNLFLLEARHGF
jgi:hypothetical protein